MKIYIWLLAFISFFLPLMLYLLTLAPTYIPVDGAEFTLCIHFWGICHPPGFPLYVLLGKIFTLIFPFGSLTYKANLFSAIFGAGTILFVYLSMVKLRVNLNLALLFALMLATSSVFWEFSISADVFTFNTFLLALTFFLTFSNQRLLSFFILGLSVSHFYLSATLFPFLIWYYWGLKPGSKLVEALAIFTLGLFPQILMYFRMLQDPPINWGHVKNLADFFYFITRAEFGSFFLITNPTLTFNLLKFFKHIMVYFYALMMNLGFIVPIMTLGYIFFAKAFKDKTITLLLISFSAMLFFQLLTISTIDPTSDKSFQISKFYLSSFLLVILLMGFVTSFIKNKKIHLAATILIVFSIIESLIFNFPSHDFSKNYFSQNLVLDALEQLPTDSLAITINHQFYFGAIYEQKVSGKFAHVKLLYFPNEKNRDSESFHSELFASKPDQEFVNKVTKGSSLKNIKSFVAEKYILETIAKNLDKPIFILQGASGEQFFSYLKPYLIPHGLWWQISPNPSSAAQSDTILENLRNNNLRADSFHQTQQREDSLIYAVSYHSAGIYLARQGKYAQALELLKKSLSVDQQNKNVQNEISLIEKIKALQQDLDKLISLSNKNQLVELGSNLVIIGNYQTAVEVFLQTISIDPNDGRLYSNTASAYALMGDANRAREFYKKALALDPNLELAKKGLEILDSSD